MVATSSGLFTASASIEDGSGSYYVDVIQTGCPDFPFPGGVSYSVLNPSGSALMKLIYARYLRCFAPNWRRNAWARPTGLNAAWRSSPLDFGKILAKECWAQGYLICKYVYLSDSFCVFNRLICSIYEVSPITHYRPIKMLVEFDPRLFIASDPAYELWLSVRTTKHSHRTLHGTQRSTHTVFLVFCTYTCFVW